MQYRLLLVFAWFVLVLGIAEAVPARPRYEPVEPPKPPPSFPDLRDTIWLGRLYAEGEQVTFHANGTLTYTVGKNGGRSPGTWKFEGAHLSFEINKWSEYKVKVQGDVIQGEGWNKGGQRCQPFLRRISTNR